MSYQEIENKSLSEILNNQELVSNSVIAELIINAGALTIRDVDNGQAPFNYSSGNWGPGYVMIKGLVSSPHVLNLLCNQLALKLIDNDVDFDFVSANVTGGMIPGGYLRNAYEILSGKNLPLVYIRNTRDISGVGKAGGHFENITGLNENLKTGMSGLIIEELVNFASTTCNAAIVLRNAGYTANESASLLFYNNPKAIEELKETELNHTSVITLPELINGAKETGLYSSKAIDSYREFLSNPLAWQEKRGLKPVNPKLRDQEKIDAINKALGDWRVYNSF